MILSICLATFFATSAEAFFFGGGSSCGCQAAAPPACPPPPPPSPCGGGVAYSAPTRFAALPSYPQPPPMPPPVYQQPIAYAPQAQPFYGGGGSGGSYVSPVKRHIKNNAYNTEVDQNEGYRRVKRDDESIFDPKCNSEDLKAIILANIDSNTATAKRQIQSAAADALGGRVDVICSRGTFSYIVNTELYCETIKDGVTCFAFKQSSS